LLSLLKSAAHGPDKARRVITWACALSPAALLLVFLTLALHVRLGLGHWPASIAENYATAAYDAHIYVFVGLVWFALLAAGPLWLLSVAVPGQRLRWKTLVCQLAACGLGWLLICLVAKLNPRGFVDWFLD